jgi:predicted SnoaL-like aldol condensation-catalyzing enzyme
MAARIRRTGRVGDGRRWALSVFALGAFTACSNDSPAGSAASPSDPSSSGMPTTDSLPMGGAGSGPGATTPVGTGTSNEESTTPAYSGPDGEARPTPGDTSPAEAVAGRVDAGGALDAPVPECARELTDANEAVVVAAIEQLFERGDIAAVDNYWGEPYLQHNPIAASGVAAFRALFSGLIRPGNSIYTLSRVVGECELVLIHGDYTSFGGPTFDMFRVEGGRLVEHWDAAATGAGPNASGHTALDGESVVRDVELTARNEALVLAFVERVLIARAVDAIDDYMSPALIEHDPESRDGSDAYLQSLRDRAITYQQVHHQIGDGNFVFVLSEGAVGGTAVAHYDLFRVDGERIVEHWDARRDVPGSTPSGLGIF